MTNSEVTNSVEELKQFVGVHAKGQQIPDVGRVLARISTDGQGPGSWTGEWSHEAALLEGRGEYLQACRHYIMARFPFTGSAARREAAERAITAFERWRAGSGRPIERLEVEIEGRRVGCWQSGLSAAERRPLLVLMGGNVSVKEQWAPSLPVFGRLGLAAVVVDLPGIGENQVPYDEKSHRFLSGLLDALADRADVAHSYALALSFSGHLALRCAMDDTRIRGVVTAGAPVSAFFTDTGWQRRIPRITADTMAHLTGVPLAELGHWALPAERLAALDIPVSYVASARDEIVPQADVRLLRRQLRQLRVLEHDDVHAAPGHVAESRFWSARELLRMRGVHGPQRLALSLAYTAARLRAGLPAGR
ncbi:alpha/beta hydrolase [Kitasatospora sp. NPDC008050]|uniref:alpha/beta hydrolase n=1 Tax=Kitasatospora sp. NPDC008050 TaxID=3364021 RepID=UPI0036F14CCD